MGFIPVIGQTFCHYCIVERIGAGGMGEVYRATDTKLGRDVALKVLPEAFAINAERMARFRREAQVLASLNHPNIATIHCLEESNDHCALVMELVEGPTLAEKIRVAQGPPSGPAAFRVEEPQRQKAAVALQFDESLHIAKQIAEGLEYAHERGIIHRDLKPANVKVRPDGTVKILDFGLAKALEDTPAAVSISDSPTISAAATREGMILGTAAYMSPEQARGKTVDRRCDIWSFGALLFEMVSGKQAFPGEDVSHTLAAVIMKEPDWSALPDELPATIGRLLRRCLTKDPKQRLRDIGEARIAIEESLSGAEDVGATPGLRWAGQAPPLQLWRRAPTWGLAAAALALGLVGTLLWVALRPVPRPTSPLRLSVELGADASLSTFVGSPIALSQDGNVLAFTAHPTKGGPTQLFVRRLDQAQATALADTEDAFSPFFSPDEQWIAFFADGKLKKISVTGGAALTLCDALDGAGGYWGEGGEIIFAPHPNSGLFRVSEAGGTPVELTMLDSSAGEFTHRWPQAVPGGKALLFTEHNLGYGFDDANIMVQSLSTGRHEIVQRGGTFGRYLPGGYLIYLHGTTLFAASFDANRLEMTGTPVPVVEGVGSDSASEGAADIAFSAGGTLLYLPGQGAYPESALFWMGPDGKTAPLRNVRAQYGDIRLSPDGRRLAMELDDEKGVSTWVYDWQRDMMSRFTLGGGASPAWTPDGLRIAFASERAKRGVPNLYWQRADGTGEVQRLAESNKWQWPKSWHPSGKFLAFEEQNPGTSPFKILILPREGSETAGWKPGKPFAFENSTGREHMPMFSPDGRWLAYWSDESGTPEVYVRPFPGLGGKWQISTNGGVFPTWSPNGKGLFYQERNGRIMVADYKVAGGAFQADKPRVWSPVPVPLMGDNRSIDVSRDGKHLAVVLKASATEAAAKEDHLIFFFNFADELRRIVPPAKR